MVMTAVKKIEKGAELFINYGGSPEHLYLQYGFQCTCGHCSGFSDDKVAELGASHWAW